MADPVNGLLAARMDPERRRRIGNALMAYQYDRETPQDAAVTERAGLFPLATYANGQTGPAWPGIIATPVEKMAQVLRGEITPGTPEFNEAGFDIAGAAMVGGLAAARPRGSLGMSGNAKGFRPEPEALMPEAGATGASRVLAETDDAYKAFVRHLQDNPQSEPTFGPPTPGIDPMKVRAEYEAAFKRHYRGGPEADPYGSLNGPQGIDLGAVMDALSFGARAAGREIDVIPKSYGSQYGYLKTPSRDQWKVRVSDHPNQSQHRAESEFNIAPGEMTVDDFLRALPTIYANARPGAALGAGLSGASERQGIRAYHGSPHDFDRFDMSKIGTGEGAQAYGHGLYFAENEAVAQSYKQPLLGMARGQSGADVVARQAMSTSATPEAAIEFIQQTIAHLRKRGPEGEKAIREFYEPAIDIVRSGGKPDGRMYEVNIKANPDEFLDWDKPLSQQSEKVRGALNSIPEAQSLQRQPIYPDLGPWRGSDLPVEILTSRSGTWPRNGMSQYDPEISAVFRDAGIPGIKYLDQGSRSAGEGSRNYVVFDANLIEILKKYGLLGMLGAGGMAQELLKPSKPTIPDDAA